MTDTQNLENIAQQILLRSQHFTEGFQILEEITRTLDSQVENLVGDLLGWQGLASDRFTALWDDYRASAQQAAGALNEAVQTLQTLAGKIDVQAEIIQIAEAVQLALQIAAGIEVGAALVEGGLNLLADASAGEAVAEEVAAEDAVNAAREIMEAIDRDAEVEIDVIQAGPGATSYPGKVTMSIEEQSLADKEFAQTSGTWKKLSYDGRVSGKALQNEVSVTDGLGGPGLKKELKLASLEAKGRIGNERLSLWGSLKPKVFSLESQGNFGGSAPGGLSFSPLKLQVRAGVNVAGYSVGVNADLGPSVLMSLPGKPGQNPDIKTPFLVAGFTLGLA